MRATSPRAAPIPQAYDSWLNQELERSSSAVVFESTSDSRTNAETLRTFDASRAPAEYESERISGTVNMKKSRQSKLWAQLAPEKCAQNPSSTWSTLLLCVTPECGTALNQNHSAGNFHSHFDVLLRHTRNIMNPIKQAQLMSRHHSFTTTSRAL